jgi:flagellar protein FliS
MYASAVRDPGQIYQTVDLNSRVGGASSHGLVELLYDDLLLTLRQAAFAMERGQHERKSERVTRALSVLFALEGALDFAKGGDIASNLSRLYRGARERVTRASIAGDAQALRDVADGIGEIAGAWRRIGLAAAA